MGKAAATGLLRYGRHLSGCDLDILGNGNGLEKVVTQVLVLADTY